MAPGGMESDVKESQLSAQFACVADAIADGSAVFFFGAGASRDSGLPDAWSLVDSSAAALAAGLEEPARSAVSEMRRAVHDRANPIEWPRLETFLQIISKRVGPKAFGVLDICGLGTPSLPHLFVADAARRYECTTVVTTNFDDCIEKAFAHHELSEFTSVVSRTSDFASVCDPRLYRIVKLHGDYPASGVDESEIVATIDAILCDAPIQKSEVLKEALRDKTVVFVGYSAADVDLRPSLQQLATRSTFWVDPGSLSPHAKLILGPSWKDHHFQMTASEFCKALQGLLHMEHADESPPRGGSFDGFFRRWAEELPASSVTLALADLSLFMGYSDTTHTLATFLEARRPDLSSRARILRAEAELRDFRFDALRRTLESLDGLEVSESELLEIGDLWRECGDPDRSRLTVQRVLDENEAPKVRAVANRQLGILETFGDGEDEADRYFRLSCDEFEGLGMEEERISSLLQMGIARLRRGNLAEAEAHLSEVVDAAREIGNTLLSAEAEKNLGEVFRTRGDYVLAHRHYDAAIQKATLFDLERVRIACIVNKGLAFRMERKIEESREAYEEAIAALRRHRAPIEYLPNALVNLATVLIDSGQAQTSFPLLDEAENLFHRLRGHARIANVEITRGHAFVACGDLDSAEEATQRARESAGDNPVLVGQLDFLRSRVLLGRSIQALESSRKAVADVGSQDDLEMVDSLLSAIKSTYATLEIM